MFGRLGKKKVSVQEFSDVLSYFILREVKEIVDDDSKIDALGLNPENKNSFFMDLLIIHMFSVCEAFRDIKIDSDKLKILLDEFHQNMAKKAVEDDEIEHFYAYFINRYNQYRKCREFTGSDYLIHLGGTFLRSLSDAEPCAIAAFEANKIHARTMGIVRDTFPEFIIKYQ